MKLITGKKRRKESARFPMKDAVRWSVWLENTKKEVVRGNLKMKDIVNDREREEVTRWLRKMEKRKKEEEKKIYAKVCVYARLYVGMYKCVCVYV